MVRFVLTTALIFSFDISAMAGALNTEYIPPDCKSQDPKPEEAPCLLDDRTVYAGNAGETDADVRAPRKPRYVPLSAAQLQQAVIPALLAGFDPDTVLADGSMTWINDHQFTATLQPKRKDGAPIQVKGEVTRQCQDASASGANASCEFTIQFKPPVREVSSVSAQISYQRSDTSGFYVKDVKITWDAPALKRALLLPVEVSLKEKVVSSVTDYTVKLLLESPSPGGSSSGPIQENSSEQAK